ncbi:unnamed protein product, partial [Polarella glacialis]
VDSQAAVMLQATPFLPTHGATSATSGSSSSVSGQRRQPLQLLSLPELVPGALCSRLAAVGVGAAALCAAIGRRRNGRRWAHVSAFGAQRKQERQSEPRDFDFSQRKDFRDKSGETSVMDGDSRRQGRDEGRSRNDGQEDYRNQRDGRPGDEGRRDDYRSRQEDRRSKFLRGQPELRSEKEEGRIRQDGRRENDRSEQDGKRPGAF